MTLIRRLTRCRARDHFLRICLRPYGHIGACRTLKQPRPVPSIKENQ